MLGAEEEQRNTEGKRARADVRALQSLIERS